MCLKYEPSIYNSKKPHKVILPPKLPPKIFVPPPPPPPPLQLTPIMDSRGLLPIANQIWDGTEYVRTSDKTQFIEITKTLDPQIKAYNASFKKPVVTNIVNIIANATYDLVASPANFNVENARALSNFTNSCYFGGAIHYLFIMHDVREYIINNINFIDPLVPVPQKNAFNDIRQLLIDMKKAPKNAPINIFPEYTRVKNAFTGNASLQEEDQHDFLLKLLGSLNSIISDIFIISGNHHAYYAINNPSELISTIPYKHAYLKITDDIIKLDTNTTLENALFQEYTRMDVREGTTALLDSNGDYVFGLDFFEITKLPQYLSIMINFSNFLNTAKLFNKIKLNTTLTLTANGTTITYLLLAVLIHRGATPASGHYTALIYDNRTGPNFEYLHYNDSIVTPYSMPVVNKFINSTFYSHDPTDLPYFVLYGDISKLN